MHSFALALSLGLPSLAMAQTYTLTTTMQGSNFFSQWNFSTAIDVNYGNVVFEPYSVASSQGLATINSAGNAIIKIDNTTVGNPADETFGRASVYMTSNAAVEIGSLVLFDALHVPFGCSVWPAFFMEGAGVTWPNKGEIDIFENVNQATTNQYSLHTLDGCTHPASLSSETGIIVSTDCFNQTNGNQGCIVKESQPNSFGAGFNNNGGGAFATLFDTNGIKTWFWPRSKIPADYSTNSPNPAGWGNPSAFFPSSSCNVEQFFGPQTMIIDIDICGAFALGVFNDTCSGNCLDLVRDPTNYNDAYFEIQFIKVFTENGSGSTATGPIPSGTSTKTGSTNTASTSTKPGAATTRMSFDFNLWIVGAFASTVLAGAFTLLSI